MVLPSSFPLPIRPPAVPGALPMVAATLTAFVGVTTLLAAFASASDATQRNGDDASSDASAVVIDEDVPARSYCFGA